MATFDEHINQAKKNLQFLASINKLSNDNWDWQVTVSYYVAVHLANAHLAKSANLHYRTHEKVKEALFNQLSPAKVPENVYTSYVKLENNSRRSRYLCHEDAGKDNTSAFFTFDKHFLKSLKHLDVLIRYIRDIYDIEITPVEIDCIELRDQKLTFFVYKQSLAA